MKIAKFTFFVSLFVVQGFAPAWGKTIRDCRHNRTLAIDACERQFPINGREKTLCYAALNYDYGVCEAEVSGRPSRVPVASAPGEAVFELAADAKPTAADCQAEWNSGWTACGASPGYTKREEDAWFACRNRVMVKLRACKRAAGVANIPEANGVESASFEPGEGHEAGNAGIAI